LTAIALTDHDTVDGIEAAVRRGAEKRLEVVPGIEFTTERPAAEIHILGYYIEHRNPRLLGTLEKIQQDRVARIYKIVGKLKELNVVLDPEEVLALSGRKVPGRPHVARALVKKGLVADFKEAFNRYLDDRSPAYVPHFKLSPEDAIALITEAGGIPVFAHPGTSCCDDVLPGLVKSGLRGLEAFYATYRPDQVKRYLDLAQKYGLLVTGGSDFHGLDSGREVKLGEFSLPDEYLGALKDEHLRGNKS